jgi:hypothetical protein
MKNRKMLLPPLFSIALVFSLILPALAVGASATVPMSDDLSIINHLAVDSSSLASAMALNAPQGKVTPMVAAGSGHTVGLKSDGTVVAAGDNSNGQCDVGGWTGINQTAAGGSHTVGLKSDGTVVAVGNNDYSDVSGWTDIKQVAAGEWHTVGVKSDGTVVAVGQSHSGQCNVGGWTDIIQVSASWGHTVGVKSDGTVVAVGYNSKGQCNVGGWTGINQTAAGGSHTVGLKNDGTVVATSPVGNWNLLLALPRRSVKKIPHPLAFASSPPQLTARQWPRK